MAVNQTPYSCQGEMIKKKENIMNTCTNAVELQVYSTDLVVRQWSSFCIAHSFFSPSFIHCRYVVPGGGGAQVRYPACSPLLSVPLNAQDPWIFCPIKSFVPGFRTLFLCFAESSLYPQGTFYEYPRILGAAQIKTITNGSADTCPRRW